MKITYSPINYNYTYNNYKRNNVPTFKANPANISKETLAKFIEKDYSIKQISDELGLDRYHVYTYLKKNNLQTSAMKEYEELKDNIVYHLERGETMSEIKAQYDYMDKDKIKQAIQTVLNKKDELELKEIGRQNRAIRIQKIKDLILQGDMRINSKTIPSGAMILSKKEKGDILREIKRERKETLKEKILDMISNGIDRHKISQNIRSSRYLISRHLEKEEIQEAKQKDLKAKFDLIKTYAYKGYEIDEISKELKISKSRIFGIMHQYNYKKQYLIDRDNGRAKLTLKYRQEGMSDEEIAQKFNITLKTLQRIIRKYGQNV